MKFKKLKRFAAAGMAAVMAAGALAGCGKGDSKTNENGDETVELVWYQIGDAQKDQEKVIEKANEYLGEKIGVNLKVITTGWGDYNQKMQVVINTGDKWDMCFTCSWANDYRSNAQKGNFLSLNDLLENEGKEIKESIDPRF